MSAKVEKVKGALERCFDAVLWEARHLPSDYERGVFLRVLVAAVGEIQPLGHISAAERKIGERVASRPRQSSKP